jgi:hypothetical protein
LDRVKSSEFFINVTEIWHLEGDTSSEWPNFLFLLDLILVIVYFYGFTVNISGMSSSTDFIVTRKQNTNTKPYIRQILIFP